MVLQEVSNLETEVRFFLPAPFYFQMYYQVDPESDELGDACLKVLVVAGLY